MKKDFGEDLPRSTTKLIKAGLRVGSVRKQIDREYIWTPHVISQQVVESPLLFIEDAKCFVCHSIP